MRLTPHPLTFLAIVLMLVFNGQSVTADGDPELLGPLLVTIDFYANQVVVQDVGTGEVYRVDTDTSTYFSLRQQWTPDGCNVVFRRYFSGEGEQYWLLSLPGLELTRVPPLGFPSWSPDGSRIAFLNFDVAGQLDIYLAHDLTSPPSLELSLDARSQIEWHSATELLYTFGGSLYARNVVNHTSRLLGNIQTPDIPATPSIFDEFMASPQGDRLVGYFNPLRFRATTNMIDTELATSEIPAYLARQQQDWDTNSRPGFDVIEAVSGETHHFDLGGQFVTTAVWSPSGERIALETDVKGDDFAIFVYDRLTGEVQRLGDAYIEEGGYFTPSWSPDGEWLAYRSPEGYLIHHLASGERIQLAPELNAGLEVYWSPVMHYPDSPQPCNE